MEWLWAVGGFIAGVVVITGLLTGAVMLGAGRLGRAIDEALDPDNVK